MEIQRQKCEVYSRVVGYLRPIAQWNEAKQAEFKDRTEFDKQLSSQCDTQKYV